MYIKSVKLKNFRNYSDLDISFSENVNVIYGENAQGKTNILEAIFLCASGRSHRTSRDMDLVRINGNNYYIKIDYKREVEEKTLEIIFDKEGKKKIRINEIPVRKLGDLIGNINAVMFSPEDLMIIKEGPSERRRFIDITLSQIKPTYFYDLQQYAKILLQRNNLLKEIRINPRLSDTLDVWNEHLISTGTKIMLLRAAFLKRLNEKAVTKHESLTGNKEELLIKYSPSIKVNDYSDRESIEKEFRKVLNYSKNKEIIKGTTMYGPQRDDYEIFLNEMNIKLYGSQGQQRTAVLAVKLAEVDIMREETGEYPLLLLDDVMSELDLVRQGFLFENINSVQTFITCTDKEILKNKKLEHIKYIEIKNGKLENNQII